MYGVQIVVYAYDDDGEIEMPESEQVAYCRGGFTLAEATGAARVLGSHMDEFPAASDSEYMEVRP